MDKKEKESKKIKLIKPFEPEVKTMDEGFEDGEAPDHRPKTKPGGG